MSTVTARKGWFHWSQKHCPCTRICRITRCADGVRVTADASDPCVTLPALAVCLQVQPRALGAAVEVLVGALRYLTAMCALARGFSCLQKGRVTCRW